MEQFETVVRKLTRALTPTFVCEPRSLPGLPATVDDWGLLHAIACKGNVRLTDVPFTLPVPWILVHRNHYNKRFFSLSKSLLSEATRFKYFRKIAVMYNGNIVVMSHEHISIFTPEGVLTHTFYAPKRQYFYNVAVDSKGLICACLYDDAKKIYWYTQEGRLVRITNTEHATTAMAALPDNLVVAEYCIYQNSRLAVYQPGSEKPVDVIESSNFPKRITKIQIHRDQIFIPREEHIMMISLHSKMISYIRIGSSVTSFAVTGDDCLLVCEKAWYISRWTCEGVFISSLEMKNVPLDVVTLPHGKLGVHFGSDTGYVEVAIHYVARA